ncbi:hypothetical protein [Amycolatopsis sp. H20-H5]|uniref:hypothetical protein n=1 Tax=Amycolatopsis sp. H20-H5 TaxID=3046309 RepID=UPI002DBDAA72|nr:hypothetical protein [Amycolatopsis sp. H20-H5]MEC3976225.1 hypothetical protein [Amycolatopsis sp. H20-H5]
MEEKNPIAFARDNFAGFVCRLELSGYDEGTDSYLQEYLTGWLEEGNGIELTGGNYETYLRVALDIADAAMCGAINFDYQGTKDYAFKDAYPRRVVAIHQPNAPSSHYADRQEYEVIAYRRAHPGRGDLTFDYSADYSTNR